MQYISLILIFIITALQLKAGGNATESQPKRMYAGFVFTPGVSHRYMAIAYTPADQTPAQQKEVFNTFDKMERPDFGFEVGGVFGVRLVRFLTIEAGVKYMMHRYSAKSPTFNLGGQGYNADSATGEYRFITTYNSHYINVPVGLNFEIGKRKVKGIVSAGLNVNLLVARTSTGKSIIDGKVTRKKTGADNFPQNYSIYNFSPYLSAGIDYQINALMSLRVTATGQMQTLKNTDTPFVRYLYFTGVNIGLLFHFDPIKKKGKA